MIGLGDLIHESSCFCFATGVTFYYSWTLTVVLLIAYIFTAVIGNLFIDTRKYKSHNYNYYYLANFNLIETAMDHCAML